MRAYKVTITDADGQQCIHTYSHAVAKSIAKQLQAKEEIEKTEITEVEIPTTKKELLEYINYFTYYEAPQS